MNQADSSGGSSAVFDPIMDDCLEFLADPYTELERIRQRGSVVWSARGNQWLVLGYNEANAILRSKDYGKRLLENWKPPNFLMQAAMQMLNRKQGSSMIIQDPPNHTRLRALVSAAFTPGVIRTLEGHIKDIANDLASNLAGRIHSHKEADLIAEFAFQLPVIVIAELIGIPVEHRNLFKRWSNDLTVSFSGAANPWQMAKSYLALQSLRGYLQNTISRKRKHPGEDLISKLAQAQAEDYERLSDNELLANLVLLFIAGHETTVNLIGNGVYNLLSQPAQLAHIQRSPELIPQAVEEILRYDPPVQIVRRLALKDVEVGGKQIKTNDVLTVLIGACNRDPEIVSNPGVFDIARPVIKHLTFGAGIHYCLGAELARTEGEIAFKTLFSHLPGLRLTNRPLSYKGPFSIRGFKQLFVSTT